MDFIVYAKIVPSFTMTEFIEENFRSMADTKITIIYKENEDHITDISFTAEQNYTPIFTEAFSTQELPLSVHFVGEKDILSENAAKSGAEQILSNLTELIRNSLKMEARIFTQEELDLKSQITDYPILKRFGEIAGIEFDWNRFHNRREFRAYIKSLLYTWAAYPCCIFRCLAITTREIRRAAHFL